MGIEIDSTSVLGSKSTCFCVGVEIDRVLVCGPTLTCFCAGVKIDLFLCGSKITCWCQKGKLTWLVMAVAIDLISVWGIELELISV